MPSEILAVLLPEPAQAVDGPSQLVTALLRDPDGVVMLCTLSSDRSLLGRARVAGRFNSGKPIVDPQTREVIGYEIEPIAVG